MVSPAVMSSSAGGVMTVVAQGAHKLGLVNIVRAEDSMTQVWHKAGIPVQTWHKNLRLKTLIYRALIVKLWSEQACSRLASHSINDWKRRVIACLALSKANKTISWLQAATSWGLIVTVRLPGKQRRIQKVTADSQEIVQHITLRRQILVIWT